MVKQHQQFLQKAFFVFQHSAVIFSVTEKVHGIRRCRGPKRDQSPIWLRYIAVAALRSSFSPVHLHLHRRSPSSSTAGPPSSRGGEIGNEARDRLYRTLSVLDMPDNGSDAENGGAGHGADGPSVPFTPLPSHAGSAPPTCANAAVHYLWPSSAGRRSGPVPLAYCHGAGSAQGYLLVRIWKIMGKMQKKIQYFPSETRKCEIEKNHGKIRSEFVSRWVRRGLAIKQYALEGAHCELPSGAAHG